MHAESRRHTHTSTDLISRPRAEHRRHSEHKPLSEPDEQIEKATHIENKPQNETAHTQHATTLVSVSEWCSIVSRIYIYIYESHARATHEPNSHAGYACAGPGHALAAAGKAHCTPATHASIGEQHASTHG